MAALFDKKTKVVKKPAYDFCDCDQTCCTSEPIREKSLSSATFVAKRIQERDTYLSMWETFTGRRNLINARNAQDFLQSSPTLPCMKQHVMARVYSKTIVGHRFYQVGSLNAYLDVYYYFSVFSYYSLLKLKILLPPFRQSSYIIFLHPVLKKTCTHFIYTQEAMENFVFPDNLQDMPIF